MLTQTLRRPYAAWSHLRAHVLAWRCPDKILVFESDDWGSIRTSSAEAHALLRARGYALHNSRFTRDVLESLDDLQYLASVLSGYRDHRGRPACFTTNMVMANPDFDAVRESRFARYSYEPVWQTWKRYDQGDIARMWAVGMTAKVFFPQFHAREHICWWKWLDALRANNQEAIETFNMGMCGVPAAVSRNGQTFFCPTYVSREVLARSDINLENMIAEGIELFSRHFGFNPVSAVAPNVTWTDEAERVWSAQGVRYIQGGPYQYEAVGDHLQLRSHYLGQRSAYGGRYLVRNCVFEPSRTPGREVWHYCLKQISRAFRATVPAVVGTHRVNFVGSVDKHNRQDGIRQLRELLRTVLKEWPDVFFLSSPELGYMIDSNVRRVGHLTVGPGECLGPLTS